MTMQPAGASNYQAIRVDNIERYGWDRDFLNRLLVEVYSEKSRFILELLQNAEDAHHPDGHGASRVRFELRPDHLRVLHDGRPFDEEDVKGVCRIGRGTKEDDATSIGRFGIGFKSVYAYTSCPRVHSPPEHFRIEKYLNPFPEQAVHPGAGWTTRFDFPLDTQRDDDRELDPHDEVVAHLATLSPRVLLFLRHIEAVEWVVDAGDRVSTLRRVDMQRGGLTLRRIETDTGTVEEWVRFPVPGASPDAPGVELAFLLGEDANGRQSVVNAPNAKAVTYFPTELRMGCGFLVQADFVLTPNREGIRRDSRANREIVERAAAAIPDALERLRDAGLFSASSLEALPLRPPEQASEPFFAPLHEATREAVRSRPLIRNANGEWRCADELRSPRHSRLPELFNVASLTDLLASERPLSWATEELSARRCPRAFESLVGKRPHFVHEGNPVVPPLVPGFAVDVGTLLRRLTPEFLADRSDGWLARLYELIGEDQTLVQACRRLPIVRTEDGEHVAPFTEDGRPQVWLAPSGATRFRTVSQSLAATGHVRDFLVRRIGLTEPDIVDDVIEGTLPRYSEDGAERPEGGAHIDDLRRILLALERAGGQKRRRLEASLRQLPVVRARRTGSDALVWACAGAVFDGRDPGLRAFLECSDGNLLLWEEYPDELDPLWDVLGVRRKPEVTRRPADSHGHVVLASRTRDHSRGLRGFDPSFDVAGMREALAAQRIEVARFVWRWAAQHVDALRGDVESSRNKDYRGSEVQPSWSVVGRMLEGTAWLPDVDGAFRVPCDVVWERLDPQLERNVSLATTLGVLGLEEHEGIGETLGLDPEGVGLLLKYRSELPALLRAMRATPEPDTPEAPPAVSGGQTGKGGETAVDPVLPEAGPNTPSSLKKGLEAARSRAAREGTKTWKAIVRDTGDQELVAMARHLASADYAGRCQVCRRTFQRKRGGWAYELVQWRPVGSKGGKAFYGNYLVLCGWHAALFKGGRYTLRDSEPIGEAELRRFVEKREPGEDEYGNLVYRIPIIFHHVAFDGDTETRSDNAYLHFAEPHWMAFRMLVEDR